MICPQCGFEQPEAAECARCGVRVDLYRQPESAPAAPLHAGGFVGVGSIYGIPEPSPPAVGAIPAAPSAPAHLETGPVLHDAFAIFFANVIPFLAISAVALLPRLAAAAFLTSGLATGRPPRTAEELSAGCLSLAVTLLAQSLGIQLATGAITYSVLRHLRGFDVTVGDSLTIGLRAMGRVLGAAFLSGLGILLGAAACVVPGVVLALRWAVAVPVALEEAPGARASLSRSSALTEGSRWPILAILVILFLLNLGFVRLVLLAAGGLVGSRTNLVTALAEIVTTAVSGTTSAVIYYRLRSLKESIDVRQLASVFD